MEERSIQWTLKAESKKLAIYTYWFHRNKSFEYPLRLEELIVSTLTILKSKPLIGIKTDIPNVHSIRIEKYRIFYSFNTAQLTILSFWDTRQNPTKHKI